MRIRLVFAFVFALVPALALGSSAPVKPWAIEEFSSLTQRMHQARTRSDWRNFQREAQTLSVFLNGSPDAAIELARARARNGDPTGALEELRKVAALGQSVPVVASLPDFAPLRPTQEFRSILEQMAQNAKPQSSAHRVLTVDDPSLLPEDIDYDDATRSFFLTSVLEAKIVRVSEGGRTQTFARSPSGWPMLALKIDRRRHVIWATEVALDGFKIVPKHDWGRSALVAYDLTSGRVLHRLQPPGSSALGDMMLLPDGNVVVSDGEQGAIYVSTKNGSGLKRIDSGDFISPQTPAYLSADAILVPDYVRGVAILNPRTKKARWLSMETYPLEGIDGAYLVGRNLFVTQNGTSPESVAVLQLDSRFARITSSATIERATPNLDPTHGVWVNGKFFYIANSGWNEIDDSGNLKRGMHRTSAYIMEYEKPAPFGAGL